jgi:hypothetical protein
MLEAIRPPAFRGRAGLLALPAFASAIAALAVGTGAGGRLGVLSGSLLVIAVAAPTALRLRLDPLDAPGLYALASAITLGVFSLVWLDSSPRLPAPGIGQPDISRALLIVAAGLAAFGAAVRLTGRVRRRVRVEVPLLSLVSGGEESPPPPRVIVGLFAIGAAGLIVGLLIGALGYNADAPAGSSLLASAQLITQVATVGLLAVVICALLAFGLDTRRYGLPLAILLVLQVLGGFVAGYKSQSILPVILVIFAYIACRLRVPWRAIAVGVAVTALVLAPANYVYRHYLRSRSQTSHRSFAGTFTDGASFFLTTRLRLIDDVAVIRARTPGVYPYGDGQRYLYLPAIVLVPRAVWPDKPVLNDGLEFSHSYWQLPPGVRSLTPITQVGDLYRNFGLTGVVAGLALWGAVLGFFTSMIGRRESLRMQVVYVVALATAVLFVETDLPEVLAGAARTLPVAALVAWAVLPGPASRPGYRRVLALLSSMRERGPRTVDLST